MVIRLAPMDVRTALAKALRTMADKVLIGDVEISDIHTDDEIIAGMRTGWRTISMRTRHRTDIPTGKRG